MPGFEHSLHLIIEKQGTWRQPLTVNQFRLVHPVELRRPYQEIRLVGKADEEGPGPAAGADVWMMSVEQERVPWAVGCCPSRAVPFSVGSLGYSGLFSPGSSEVVTPGEPSNSLLFSTPFA